MRSKERRTLLLEALSAGEEIDIEDLARRFEVSASTIRRDLQQLSSSEAIKRTYGGAILAHPTAESSLSQRQATNRAQKEAIAWAASGFLAQDDILILDGGRRSPALATACGTAAIASFQTTSRSSLL